MTKKEFINSLKPKGTYAKTDFTKYVELSASKIRAALLNKTPDYLLPIFNLIEDKDSSVGSEIEKRTLSVLNKEYKTSLPESYVSSIYDITKASLEAKLFGIAVVELYLDDNLEFAFRHIDREHFSVQDKKVYLRTKTKDFVAKPPRFIVLRKKPVLIKIIWIVFAKHFVLSHYLKFTEFLGVPPLIAHSHSSDESVIDGITESIKNLKSGAFGVFANDDVIKILEGKGSQEDFLSFVSYADAEIAKVINGQVLSSNVGSSGSYSLAKIHEANRQEIVNADIKNANFYVNHLFNIVGIKADFKIPLTKNIEELTRAQTLQMLKNIGIEADETQIAREFNLKLKNGTTSLSQNAKTKNMPLSSHEVSTNAHEYKKEDNEIKSIVAKVLKDASSYEEAYENLVNNFSHLDLNALESELIKVIANASMDGYQE